MRCIITILLMAVAVSCHPVEEVSITDNEKIISLSFVESFARDLIYNGSVLLGIPVMDPFSEREFAMQLPGLITVDIEGEDATITGLGGFVFNELVFTNIFLNAIRYDILLPSISVRAPYYALEGLMFNALPIYGRGGVVFDIANLRMTGVARLTRVNKSLQINNIEDAKFSLDAVRSRLTGLLGGGDMDNVVNAIIQDLVADYMTRFSSQVSQLTTPHIVTVMNKILAKLPFV